MLLISSLLAQIRDRTAFHRPLVEALSTRPSPIATYDKPREKTYLAEPIHSPMIANPNDPITERCTLLWRRRASKRIVGPAVRDDRGRSALDDMYGHIERARQSLDLGVND